MWSPASLSQPAKFHMLPAISCCRGGLRAVAGRISSAKRSAPAAAPSHRPGPTATSKRAVSVVQSSAPNAAVAVASTSRAMVERLARVSGGADLACEGDRGVKCFPVSRTMDSRAVDAQPRALLQCPFRISAALRSFRQRARPACAALPAGLSGTAGSPSAVAIIVSSTWMAWPSRPPLAEEVRELRLRAGRPGRAGVPAAARGWPGRPVRRGRR